MNAPSSIPKMPLALGVAGLIPFWGLMLAMATALPNPVAGIGWGGALETYGAVIVSFLGGVRWGIATTAPSQQRAARHYAVAVLPSLLAWTALALPPPGALACLGLIALVLGPIDLDFVKAGFAPAWFARLRMVLSAGAGLALLLGAYAAWLGRG